MEIKEIVKYNTSLLFNKNYTIFILASLIVPVALNLSNAMYLEMIIPLCGIFIFNNIMFYEKELNICEAFFMSNIKKSTILLVRVLINIVYYILLSLLFYWYIRIILQNSYVDIFANPDEVNIIILLVIGCINFIYLGLIGMTISNVSKKPIIGLSISIAYGVIWMVQYYNLRDIIINPFSYSAGCEDYLIYKFITIIQIVILLKFNCYWVDNKFYRK